MDPLTNIIMGLGALALIAAVILWVAIIVIASKAVKDIDHEHDAERDAGYSEEEIRRMCEGDEPVIKCMDCGVPIRNKRRPLRIVCSACYQIREEQVNEWARIQQLN